MRLLNVILGLLGVLVIASTAQAAINLEGVPTSVPDSLSQDPGAVIDKVIGSLPKSNADFTELADAAKERISPTTVERVKNILKAIGGAFVWVVEWMIQLIKYGLGKL